MNKENNHNEIIRSIYDPKLIRDKRIESAKKILKKENSIIADKKSSFFAVKSDSTKGYYTVKLEPKKICNCYDFSRFIEIDDKHECKHIRAVDMAVKDKLKIQVKDLTTLLESSNIEDDKN